MLYRQEEFKFEKVILCIQTRKSVHNSLYDQDILYGKCGKFSLSEMTKLILLDTLLEEAYINYYLERLLTFECLCFSVTKYVIQG